ncbi:MAG: FxsA family protein [Pseudomonadota bacterium]
MWLLIAFIAVPLIEIGLFIQVGGWLGLWPTLLIVVLTALAGTYLVRTQGLAALANLQRSMGDLQDPTKPLAHGAMILFSGALLLTPGFFTDAVGFALLVPGIRDQIIKTITARVKTQQNTEQRAENIVLDGEFDEVPPNDGPSPWTKD